MLITDRFVVLNNPKTGSSFVRTVLKQVHGYTPPRTPVGRLLEERGLRHRDGLRELLRPNIKPTVPGPADQHGTWVQVPARDRDKLMVSVIRDPFTRLMSMYRYQWWATTPPIAEATIRARFPHFPEISLEELCDIHDMVVAEQVPAMPANARIGIQTWQFIQMFATDPAAVARKLSPAYIADVGLADDLPRSTFLRTEGLNAQLHAFLLASGYAPERIAFISDASPVNTSDERTRGTPMSQQVIDRVADRERLLFALFERLGFSYPRPAVPA